MKKSVKYVCIISIIFLFLSVNYAQPKQQTNNSARDLYSCYSPDGSKIAFTSDGSGDNQIYNIPFSGGAAKRITNNTVNDNESQGSSYGSKLVFSSNETGNEEISILLSDENIACIKLRSAKFNDYLQMVKFGGNWKIVNVLWTMGADVPNQPERKDFDTAYAKEKIQSVINDYYTGLYSHDIESIERTIHPEFSFAKLRKLPQTGEFTVSRYGRSFIIEIARAKLQKVSNDKKKVAVKILDMMDGMAFVEAVSSFSKSYYQLQMFDGSWKVINILSKPI